MLRLFVRLIAVANSVGCEANLCRKVHDDLSASSLRLWQTAMKPCPCICRLETRQIQVIIQHASQEEEQTGTNNQQ